MTPNTMKSENFTKRTRSRASSHEDRVMVMDSLPETALLALIQAHADQGSIVSSISSINLNPAQSVEAAQSMPWLHSLLAGGYLQASLDMAWDQGAPAGLGMNTLANGEAIDRQHQRFTTLMGFMKKAQFAPEGTDPLYGHQDVQALQPFVASLPVTPAFKQFFSSLVQRILADAQAVDAIAAPASQSANLRTRAAKGFAFSTRIDRETLMTQALCAACALNLPELIKPLALHCPEALTGWVEMKPFLGDAWDFTNRTKDEAAINAYFCAVQFSNPDCIDALVAAGMAPDAPLLKEWLPKGKNKDFQEYKIEAFLTRAAPTCLPSVLTKAIAWSSTQTREADTDLTGAILQALHRQQFWDLANYLPTFFRCGHLDGKPADSIRAAVEGGFPEVVEHFRVAGTIPWGRLGIESHDPSESEWKTPIPDSDIILSASFGAANADEERKTRIEQAVLILFDAAQDAPNPAEAIKGLTEVFDFQTLVEDKLHHTVEPLDSMLAVPFEKIMLRFQKAGLDVSVPYNTTGETLLAKAEEVAPTLAHTMRTFLNHQKALTALADMASEDQLQPTRAASSTHFPSQRATP